MKSSVALGDVAQFVNGAAFKPEDWGDEGLPIIRIQNLTDPSKPYNRTLRAVSDKLRVRRGDLLVSWSATLGVFTWDLDEDGLLNQHIFRVLPDETKVDRAYLRFALNEAIGAMGQHLHGATMQHVNRGAFIGTQMPLPSLPEQRRIAAILDQADELRTKRRRALTLLDELADSLFTDMFWQGTSQSTFKELSIAEACSVVVDCVNKTAPLSETPTEFKMIRTTNVRNMRVDISSVRYVDEETFLRWNSRLTPRRGDVILTREAPAGEAGILQSDDNVFLGQRLMLYRPDTQKLLPEYLLFALMSPLVRMRFDRVASGSTVKHLSVPFCRSFELPIPEITLQAKFSVRINGISKTRELAERASLEADELFASLQHRAFRGEL